jgi:hypothetical protein
VTKGAPTTQQVDSLKQASFTAAIGAKDNICLGMTGNMDAFQVSHLENVQIREIHSASKPRPTRP